MTDLVTRTSPFRLNGALNFLPKNRLGKGVENLIEQVFSLKRLDQLYRQLPPSRDDQEFLAKVFETFNIDYQASPEELARIPKTGPLVIVANHPFGAIEGVIMAALLRQVRPDVKIMANFILKRISEISDLFIPVNPFGGHQATQNNAAPLKEAIRWLKQDGLLMVFPAGEVSHFSPKQGKIIDPPWSRSIGRLIQLTQAPVQPVYFNGANSLLFQMAGLMHPALRTALLPRELVNKANTSIPIHIGQVIPRNKLKNVGDEQELIDYLKLRTYMLRTQPKETLTQPPGSQSATPVIPAQDSGMMAWEVNALPTQQHLVDNGELQVYCGYAKQIPFILREIGRLREITFRATGEGTNKSIDLDEYDRYYLHLFIWNRDKQEIVGAYRLGEGDKIMTRYGIKGFYSHSLFKYSKKLIHKLYPALELGRSFIRQEYQRSFAPLLLLWKGIGAFVAQNPQYRKLFGPVSISNDYQRASQQLMVDFLRANNRLPQLARLVKPRKPFKVKALSVLNKAHTRLKDIDNISELVAAIEQDQKGIPILLKQYLKLGGQILEFNVDDQFNQALDGLIMVDLLYTDPKVLAKYMGKPAAEQFLAYHQPATHQATSA